MLQRSTRSAPLTVFLATLCLYLGSAAQAKPVDNFVLLDHTGKAHELYYQSDAKAVVIMVQGNGCPIVRNALTDFRAVQTNFEQQGVRFFMLNANLQDTRESIAKEAAEWGITAPILDDSTQLVGESLDLVRTAEVLVLDPKTWEIAYRGPLNDRLNYERQKEKAQNHYLADTLTALLADEPIEVAQRDSIGCLINFPEKQAQAQHAQISYSDTIAPILQQNCAVCHTQGGIGPWAMTDYNMIRGFAPMIREVLRTKRMPPWHADPHVGEFIGDKSISDQDKKTLVHWIEAGAPRGAGPDPLKLQPVAHTEWPLGEPDLIVEVPAHNVPASGVVDYQFPVVDNPLQEAVWVRAATVVPGDRAAVHHVLMGASEPGAPIEQDRDSVFDNYIIGYAPGNESAEMPPGTGVYLEPGSKFLLQMHYTPYGKATTDVTRVGLYFHKQAPGNFLRHQVVLDPTIQIPAHDGAHEETAYYEFDREALLWSVVPHSHYRGKASKFELVRTDGSSELLLSVPNYDFNWQRTYEFAEPITIPAGARIVHSTVYDNSERNPGNPDPNRDVGWGLQSWDEMLYGAFSFSWVDESSDQPTHNKELSETYQFVGFLDKNMDGKLSWAELPMQMKKRLVQGFKLADSNGDGGLSAEELFELNRRKVASAR